MKLDDILSAAITGLVTILFVAETIATWPAPFQLQKFHLERDNPFAVVLHHFPAERVILTSSNN